MQMLELDQGTQQAKYILLKEAVIFCGGERIDCKEDVAIFRPVHPVTQDENNHWLGNVQGKGKHF